MRCWWSARSVTASGGVPAAGLPSAVQRPISARRARVVRARSSASGAGLRASGAPGRGREVPGSCVGCCWAACSSPPQPARHRRRARRAMRTLIRHGLPVRFGHDERGRGHVRDAPGAGDDRGVRQPRLDRAAVPGRLPRRLPLRARAARGGGGRHRRRLRAGERTPRAGEPPHRARGRQRDGGDVHRPGQQGAAGDHRGPADPLADDAPGAAHQPRRRADAASAREVELRAAARAGRPARARARDAPRGAAAARPGVRLDPDGRLARRGRRRRGGTPDHAHGRGARGRRPRAGARARRAAPRRRAPPARGGGGRRRAGGPPAAASPVLVVGPDVDASGAWDAAVALAEKLRLPVWSAPATGGGRIGFPEDHPHFQGVLPPAVGPVSETLAGHDLILVAGSSVFPYYPNLPGPLLPDGAALVAITSDPDEAARAPMGDAIVADVRLTLESLLAAVKPSEREAPAPRAPAEPAEDADPMSASAAIAALADVFPADGIVALESPASTFAIRNRLRLSRPGSYYFSAGGGLGFALPASIGVQMAQPDRPVVCVLGGGSPQYAIQSFWTAAAYDVPVTFLVLRNDECAILKWFGQIERVTGAPGLDLPALDVAAVAEGYGVAAARVEGREALTEALREAIGAEAPRLVEARVAPGMALA